MIEEALPPAARASAEENGSESQPSAKTKPPFQSPKSTDRDDLKRKTGDISLYKYYFSSVGWPKALMFLFFVHLDVFGESFSRELTLYNPDGQAINPWSRNMAEDVV